LSIILARVPPQAGRGPSRLRLAFRIGALAAPLLFAGCASSVPSSGPVARSTCLGPNHDVANLGAVNPQKTYGCKADNDGYLAEDRSVPIRGD
jgi:hypothetical protein